MIQENLRESWEHEQKADCEGASTGEEMALRDWAAGHPCYLLLDIRLSKKGTVGTFGEGNFSGMTEPEVRL
jgi:hypothetical protein